jgi:peptide/nickel transport system substrate-binding protein
MKGGRERWTFRDSFRYDSMLCGASARRFAPALLIAFALVMAASAASAETVLRIVPHADLKNIDPIWTTAYITRNHGYMIYDTLFAMDEQLKPHPQMVESWKQSGDGLTYTFVLRPGLKWHDGQPVRAADCVASLKRWGARDAMGQKLMEFSKGLDVVDARTFRLVLKEPYGLVIPSLAKISSNVPFMMPERIAATDPFTQIKENIGSGPFKFVAEQWVPGNKVVYVRNADYVPRDEPPSFASGGKRVYVDRVEWLYIPDPSTAQAALAAGEVDYYEIPPVDLVPLMERDPRLIVKVLDPLGVQGMLRPNHLHPPFNDVRARQALLWMVKQEDYLRAMIGDPRYWKSCAALFICGTVYASDAGAVGPQDLERARQMMAESGYKGEPVVLMDPTDIPMSHAATLVTAQLLRKIGVNVQVQAMDWSTLTSRRAEKKSPAEGGWNLFHTWWTGADVISPLGNIGIAANCEKAWFGWPCSAEMEKVRDQIARAADLPEQQRQAVKLQELAYRDVPYVSIGQWQLPTAYRKSLSGVIVSPVPFFWNIKKQE